MWPQGWKVLWHYGWVLLITSHMQCGREDILFLVCHVTSHDFFIRVTWHYGWVSLIICDYSAKFGDHRLCGRGDIKLSFCHVTSHDYVVRGSCDIMGELPSSWVTTLPSLVAIGFAVKVILFLICHITLCDHMVRWSCGIMGGCHHSHKKQKYSLETQVVLIEISILCWNLLSSPKHWE